MPWTIGSQGPPIPKTQLWIEGDAVGEARLPPPPKHQSLLPCRNEGKEAEKYSHSAGTMTLATCYIEEPCKALQKTKFKKKN